MDSKVGTVKYSAPAVVTEENFNSVETNCDITTLKRNSRYKLMNS